MHAAISNAVLAATAMLHGKQPCLNSPHLSLLQRRRRIPKPFPKPSVMTVAVPTPSLEPAVLDPPHPVVGAAGGVHGARVGRHRRVQAGSASIVLRNIFKVNIVGFPYRCPPADVTVLSIFCPHSSQVQPRTQRTRSTVLILQMKP